jgi:hypothetical protein
VEVVPCETRVVMSSLRGMEGVLVVVVVNVLWVAELGGEGVLEGSLVWPMSETLEEFREVE